MYNEVMYPPNETMYGVIVPGVVEVIHEFQCLTSITGWGKVYAVRIVAEIGQIEQFQDYLKSLNILDWIECSINLENVNSICHQGVHWMKER